MIPLASVEIEEQQLYEIRDYIYFVWVGIIFVIGLITFRNGYAHYGIDQPTDKPLQAQTAYGLFGFLIFSCFVSLIPGILLPNFKTVLDESTALYLVQFIGQLLGIGSIIGFAYLCPDSVKFAPSASLSAPLPHTPSTFREEVNLGWKSFSFKNLWPNFFSLCTLAILASLIWKAFYYFCEQAGQILPEDAQPLVNLIANFDWSGPISPIIILALSCTIGAPVIEEFVFRGMIYPSFKTWLPRGYAIILTGLIFGIIHGSLSAVLPLTAFGCLLCIIRDRFGLFTCIALHALFNFHTLIWLYLAPNASSQF